MNDSDFLFSYGSAGSGRHRECSEQNIQLNFHQEAKMLPLTHRMSKFWLRSRYMENILFLELLIPLEGHICCLLTLFQKIKCAGNTMISHNFQIQTTSNCFKLQFNYCVTIGLETQQ